LPVSYYIYYRVAVPQQAKQVVLGLQARLATDTGIRGRLLHKQDEPALWMEIYEGVSDPARFEAALARLLPAAQFEALLQPGSGRKIERFVEPESGQCA
jgi:Domain of unknown function (DUF4936)